MTIRTLNQSSMNMTDGWQRIQVGYDGVAVDDPFNDLRERLDEDVARRVDRDATLLSIDYAALDGPALAALRTEVGNPSWELPAWAPETSRREWDAIELRHEEALIQAEADLLAHEAMPSADPKRHAARRDELKKALTARESAAVSAELDRDFNDSSLAWSERQHDDMVKWVAATRVLAIERELALERELGEGRKPNRSMPLRDIGPNADVSALIAEQQYEQNYLVPGSYERELADQTRSLDRLKGTVPSDYLERLSQRMEPLQEWVTTQPSWWVRDRHRQLGPADRTLDRASALELARIGTAMAAAEIERDGALFEVEQYEHIDADRAKVQRATAEDYQQRIDKLSEKRAEVMERASSPERWADSSEAALAAVYADEYRIRHAIATERAVERSLVNPPVQVVERIGPRPHQSLFGPKQLEQRQAWDGVAHDVEHERLGREIAERDGIEPPEPRDATAQRALEAEIEAVREQQGLPPEQQLATQHEVGALEQS